MHLKFNAYNMNTHKNACTHTVIYRAMGLKKRFLRRKSFREDLKELTGEGSWKTVVESAEIRADYC